MKNSIFLGILLCLTLTSYAQNINFNDINFKNALLNSTPAIDTNADGEISKTEAEKVLYISVPEKNIHNLTGIEYFINITSLNVSKNRLTTISLTKNTKLQYLYVNQNQLTQLIVSGCTQLERLDANDNQLTQLDVSKNAILFELKIINNSFKRLAIDNNAKLSILHAWSNQLEELDITKNLNLTRLYLWGNKLTRLDVSKNTKLDELNIGNNFLTTIDASINTMLTHLDVRESLLTSIKLPVTSTLRIINVSKNKLNSIDLTGNVNLERLDIGSNALTEIDLSQNVNLVNLNCSKNKITNLDARNCKIVYLDVHDNNELKTMFVTHQFLNKFVKMENCPKLEFICLHKFYNDIAYIQNKVNQLGYTCVVSTDCSLAPTAKNINFPDPNFKAGLVAKYDTNSDNEISVDEAEKVIIIDLENSNISNIIGIEYFVNLRVLLLKNNKITSADLSKNDKLNTIELANNKLTSIDLRNKALLRYLTLDNNQLPQISLSSSIDLYVLRLSNNQITTLDIASNTNLETLDISRNLISKIDIRNCKSINIVNVSNNPNLREAYLTGNHSFYQSSQHFSGVVHHVKRLYLYGCPKLNFVCVNSVPFLNDIKNHIKFTLGLFNCNVNTSCKPTKTSAFDNHFILSPNPTSSYLAITPKDPLTSGNATVTILRLSGEIAKKVVVKFVVDPRDEFINDNPFSAPTPSVHNGLIGLNSVLIDVTTLPVGQYILHLQSKIGLLTTKFIKTN